MLHALLLSLLDAPDLAQAAGRGEGAEVFEVLVRADDAVQEVRVLGEVVQEGAIEGFEHEEEQTRVAFVGKEE